MKKLQCNGNKIDRQTDSLLDRPLKDALEVSRLVEKISPRSGFLSSISYLHRDQL